MTGTSKNTNAGHSNLASPLLSNLFPSPPSSAGINETPLLLPLDLIQDTDNRTNSQNGIAASTVSTATNDTVTVTHFSEKRGTMEKISVPSLNIFNAEFKAESSKPSTNPFLTPTKPTNPFHESHAISPIDTEPITLINDNDIISICSENNNDIDTTTLMSKSEMFKKPTNPFVAADEIDNENHTDRANNNDALNNFINNNIVVHAELDELNKNKKNIEVNSN